LADAERLSWHEAFEGFAARVHGSANLKERGDWRGEVRARCADWQFVLIGFYDGGTSYDGSESGWSWGTRATLRFRSKARGRFGQAIPLGDRGEFIGRRTPATWRGRITGRNTVWELGFSESHIVTDVNRLVRLHEAFESTMRHLRCAGEAETGSLG
jgi:hypothetical protein